MDNNVTTTTTTTTTTAATIERCSTKGFPPQDLMNNNKSPSLAKRKPFGSVAIISNGNDLQNNELKSPPVSSSTTTSSHRAMNDDDRLESGSVPDADLTESLATATEALTEILVKKTAVVDSNGNVDNGTSGSAVPRQPNVSSSSTQTECTAPHVCCCSNEWSCWKSSAAADKTGPCGAAAASGSVQCQCQSTASRCCRRHRRKKSVAAVSSRGSGTGMAAVAGGDKINNGCRCPVVVPKYSNSWRDLRKAAGGNNDKQRSNVIGRFQSCDDNMSSSKPPSPV